MAPCWPWVERLWRSARDNLTYNILTGWTASWKDWSSLSPCLSGTLGASPATKLSYKCPLGQLIRHESVGQQLPERRHFQSLLRSTWPLNEKMKTIYVMSIIFKFEIQTYLYVSINPPNESISISFHRHSLRNNQQTNVFQDSRPWVLGTGQSLMHRLSESQLHAETDVHTQVSDAAQCRWQSQLLKIRSISCSECQTISCGDYLEKTGTMNDFHSDKSKAIGILKKMDSGNSCRYFR